MMNSNTRIGRWVARGAAATVAVVAVAAGLQAGAAGAALASAKPTPGTQPVAGHLFPVAGHHDYGAACAKPTAHHAACLALVRTNVTPRRLPAHPNAIPGGVGYGPAQLQAAYALPSGTAGSGQTVAVVDAFNDPNAASDLATYRAAAGLPACGSGCFSVVNENGATSPLPASDPGWGMEESLDVDMVSAVCPLCHIILVEASSASTNDLGTAVNTAVNLGAKFVTNSYGGSESSTDPTTDSQYYNHPGVAVTASAGDDGYGVEYPAASPDVVAVGGTSLSTAANSRGWTETAWTGSGSGCSAFSAKPSWQTVAVAGCTHRVNNDVAAVADPNTGVAVYDSSQGGWLEVGGTSVSSPIIAAVYALAGTPAAGSYPAMYLYSNPTKLFDVTSGSDGSCSGSLLCTAGVGYDGPTGLGTPNGTAAFTLAAPGPVTVANPGNQTGNVGTAASLSLAASGGKPPYTFSATGLPTGLSINSATGVISGTPTTSGTFSVTATVKDTANTSASASFTWAINATGGCTVGQLLGNPGFESGNTGWTTTPAVIGQNGPSEPAHSGTWDAWLDGYGTTHTDTLSQAVTIPAACTKTTVSFWLHIDTAETTTTTQFDKLTLTANGTTIATFSNLNHNTGYAQHSFSLGGLVGPVTLKFTGTEDSSLQTSFVIDDTAVTTG